MRTGHLLGFYGARVLTVTWDASHISADYTLSNGNLTATHATTDTAQRAGYATLGRDAATANHYWEMTLSSGTHSGTGISFGTSGFNNNDIPGNTGGRYTYQKSGGTLSGGSAAAGSFTSYTTGDTVGLLLKNGKIYLRKGATWQNSGDPVAQTGFVWSGVTGTHFPMLNTFRTSDVVLGRFKAADLVNSLPSGSSAWES